MSMSTAAFLHLARRARGETQQPRWTDDARTPEKSADRPGAAWARKMHHGVVMRTVAILSLFMLAPAAARAQQVQPPPQDPQEFALAQPNQLPQQMPEPYLPPQDPYDTAADPSQIDWPQDVAAEEPAVDSYDDGYDPQAYTGFQDELAPYGDWIDDSSYGRVWAPEASLVGADFTPYYSGGHWVLTEFGWTWVSDYSWGWAPFHYGRWIVIVGHGWCWVPGTIWGPAWVAWRAGDGFVGWAPLPPRGVSVAVTYGGHSGWRFSRAADLAAPRPRCIPPRDTRGMFHRTTMVTNDRVLTRGPTTVHINAGPRHIPGALPARLNTVAPHAFPQRAILPHRGATMSERPWIRAAATGGTPAGNGGGRGIGAPVGAGNGRTWHAPPPSSAPATRIYNPPRPVAPMHGGGNQPLFTSSAPHIFNPNPSPVSSAPRFNNPTPASAAPHIYNPPPASAAPRVFNSQPNSQPMYGAPHTFGGSPARAYNPPPRAFPSSPVVTPQRTFTPAPAPFQHAPAPSFHQAFTPPATHAPPARSFSPPASSGWSGHAAGGGGAHFGGGHRR